MTRGGHRLWVGLSLLSVLACLPLITSQDYIFNMVFLVCLYTILSQSWNIFAGFCGQISLGHAAFFGLGALAARYLWLAGAPSFLSLAGAGAASLVLAMIVGVPTLKLKSHYFAIGTLALAMIALIAAQNNLPEISFCPPDWMSNRQILYNYYLALLLAALVMALTFWLSRSRLGLAMLSIREDEPAAEAVGIRTFKYKVISLGVSAFIAGVAGGLFATYYACYYLYVPFQLGWSFDPLLITFIGGAGTVWGPVLGSFLYVVLKEIFAISLGQISVLIFGALFIVIVLFFPTGLIGLLDRLWRRK